jgi:DNA-binding response OmpR family regulator
MPKILYVEDNESLSFVTSDQLQKRNYEVVCSDNGKNALDLFNHNIFDLCILDVMLPEMDGFDLAKNIRSKNKQVPIIFLTARSLQEDRIEGLKLGGDDYLTKPFDMDELCLKIDVFLKRNLVNDSENNSYKIGAYELIVEEQKLRLNEIYRSLTIKETKLLTMMAKNLNTVIRREDILMSLWGKNDYFLGRSLDVFISRLRKYLIEDNHVVIENIRGVGFKMNA